MGKLLRVLMMVLGVLTLLAGLVLAVHVGPDDEVRLGSHQVGADDDALIVTQDDFFEYRDVTLTVRAESPGGVFVGAAPAREVTDFAKGSKRYELYAFDASGTLTGQEQKGGDAADPAGADFWTEKADGSGEQHVTLRLTDRPMGIVVAPTKPGKGTQVGLGIVLDGLFLLALVVALVGLALLVGGILLGRRAKRDRQQPALVEREPAEVGAADLRSLLSVVLAGLLATVLGGCFAVPQKVDAGDAEVPAAVADEDAVAALLKDYDRRNNAAIKVGSNKPYTASGWRNADTAALLEQDRYDTAAARVRKTSSKGFTHDAPDAAYVPASKGYPLFVITVGDFSTTKDEKSTYTGLEVLSRGAATAPWLSEVSIGIKRDRVPTALAYGEASTPTSAQVKKARAVAASLTKYYRDGTTPGYALTKDVSFPVREARKQQRAAKQFIATGRVTAAPYGQDDSSVRVVRVKGGVLAVASYDVDIVYTPKPGVQLNFNGLEGKVLGNEPRSQLTRPGVGYAAWVIPDSGKPELVGGGWDAVLS